LALLLAATAIVPVVCAEAQTSGVVPTEIMTTVPQASVSNDLIEKNYISIEKAQEQALDAFAESVYIKTLGDSVDWTGASLNLEPLVITDLNGEKLLYQFWVEKDGKQIGKIRISASKVLGSPIKMVGTASPDEFDQPVLERIAKDVAGKKFPGYVVASTKPVCYDYPYLGLFVELLNPEIKETKQIVIDASFKDYLVVNQDSGKISENSQMWSYYGSLSDTQIPENLNVWAKEDGRISKNTEKIESLKISEKTTQSGISLMTSDSKDANAMKLVILAGIDSAGQVKTLSPFHVTFQGYRDWCMIGAAWAITDYYYNKGRIPSSRTLEQIGTKMQASGTHGAPNAGAEFAYYVDSWSSGGLGMSWGRQTRNPYFYEIMNSIDYGDPLKTVTASGHINPTLPSGHARACYGYDDRYTTKRVYYSDSRDGPSGNLYVEDFQPSLSFIYHL
jgi:hypothetical protein